MSDSKIHKAPKDFERFGIWWGCYIEQNAKHDLCINNDFDLDIAPLTDERLQGLIKETKEFYYKLIDLRDSLNKDK